ncbi:hypothetical protein ZOSMA_10G01510 [Zostera marina]|uniref:Uncharacterized protein n=1 Tax=Zostera marina TaxID=29655 RepID=A0A0K9Q5Q3_ZOSMR|nr:hypothetical protein ZOSMA_10G01510 [Zostera marina]
MKVVCVWLRKMVFPLKRALVSVAVRVKSRKSGTGLTKLHDDVQTCEYEDVQVMWDMLSRTKMESKKNVISKSRIQSFW